MDLENVSQSCDSASKILPETRVADKLKAVMRDAYLFLKRRSHFPHAAFSLQESSEAVNDQKLDTINSVPLQSTSLGKQDTDGQQNTYSLGSSLRLLPPPLFISTRRLLHTSGPKIPQQQEGFIGKSRLSTFASSPPLQLSSQHQRKGLRKPKSRATNVTPSPGRQLP